MNKGKPIQLTMSNIEFLRKTHRPIYYKAKLNRMRNGDTLILGSICAEYPINSKDPDSDYIDAYAQSYIKKETKGVYLFTGLWTLPTKPTRPVIWCEGRFKIERGNLYFEEGAARNNNLRNFFLISRWIARLKKMTEGEYRECVINRDDDTTLFDNPFYLNGLPYLYDGLVLDKKLRTVDTCILRYQREEDKLIPFKQGRISHIIFDSDIMNTICTPPFQAIVEIGIASGAVTFNH